MEHDPWIDLKAYQAGIDGQRIAIMGYSHHAEEEDHKGVTHKVMDDLKSGNVKMSPFFKHISDYFAFPDPWAFWQKVLFFNFVPGIVGDGSRRFATVKEAHAAGAARAQRLVELYRPDKLFVFSTKAWNSLPDWPHEPEPVGRSLAPGLEVCRITMDGHTTLACGLRHTQGAIKADMLAAVKAGMALRS